MSRTWTSVPGWNSVAFCMTSASVSLSQPLLWNPFLVTLLVLCCAFLSSSDSTKAAVSVAQRSRAPSLRGSLFFVFLALY